MKLALVFGAWSLTFRGAFTFSNLWDDPRGLTGSEYGFVRIAEELQKLGHEVHLFTKAAESEWQGMRVHPLEELPEIGPEYDAAISINEFDILRETHPRLKVVENWLNGFTHCRVGFADDVGLITGCSEPHLAKVESGDWHDVDTTTGLAKGQYVHDPSKWIVNRLGCDPEPDPEGVIKQKVPGRVIYCSSPDRGLHWLLQEWPAIKHAVPHAHLRIFYRLEPWLRGFDNTPYFPPIEPLRRRAIYIEEALERLKGYDIEVVGSVSRNRIAQEMREAEVLAYPCDTVSWSEGFSCSTMEACGYGCAPVITDCDALGEIYQDLAPAQRGDWKNWRDDVIAALQNWQERRSYACSNPPGQVQRGRALASTMTWSAHTARLADAIRERLPCCSSTPSD